MNIELKELRDNMKYHSKMMWETNNLNREIGRFPEPTPLQVIKEYLRGRLQPWMKDDDHFYLVEAHEARTVYELMSIFTRLYAKHARRLSVLQSRHTEVILKDLPNNYQASPIKVNSTINIWELEITPEDNGLDLL